MTRIARIVRDSRGAAMIEFAIALPVLVLFIYGIFTIGMVLQANAGMQHALGEGARLATLCLNPTPTSGCTVATDQQIADQMNSAVFGSGSRSGRFVVNPPAPGPGYLTLSVTYTMPMDFLFFTLPDVQMTRTKRVYTAA